MIQNVHTCIAAGDDKDTAGLVGEVLLSKSGLGDEKALADGIHVNHGCGVEILGDSNNGGDKISMAMNVSIEQGSSL